MGIRLLLDFLKSDSTALDSVPKRFTLDVPAKSPPYDETQAKPTLTHMVLAKLVQTEKVMMQISPTLLLCNIPSCQISHSVRNNILNNKKSMGHIYSIKINDF